MVQRLQRWRRRPEDDGYVEVFGTDNGKVASRISQALLLLERVIVFFVDYDKAWVL